MAKKIVNNVLMDLTPEEEAERIARELACRNPTPPIIRIYIQLIGSMLALPHSVALTGPTVDSSK